MTKRALKQARVNDVPPLVPGAEEKQWIGAQRVFFFFKGFKSQDAQNSIHCSSPLWQKHFPHAPLYVVQTSV